jgi:hypothetical protein
MRRLSVCWDCIIVHPNQFSKNSIIVTAVIRELQELTVLKIVQILSTEGSEKCRVFQKEFYNSTPNVTV